MNSRELIDQADRRYREIGGLSRGWGQGSWCNGYIQGWMEHTPDLRLAALERENETLRAKKAQKQMIADGYRENYREVKRRAEALEAEYREERAQRQMAEDEVKRLRTALGPDLAGRELAVLLECVAAAAFSAGGGPVYDCLVEKARQIRAALAFQEQALIEASTVVPPNEAWLIGPKADDSGPELKAKIINIGEQPQGKEEAGER